MTDLTEINSGYTLSDTEYRQPEKIWNEMFLYIFFANMAQALGHLMSNTLLGKYADFLGAPADHVGWLISSFAITALAFRVVAGPCINSLDKRRILVGSYLLLAISYAGYGFSKSFGWLMAFRLIQGIGMSFSGACCLAIVSDTLPKDKLNTGLGYFACGQVAAQAVGPAVGLQLVDWFGFNAAYQITAVETVVAALITSRLKLAPRPPKRFSINFEEIIARAALVPTVIATLVGIGFTTISAFLVVYAEKRGVVEGIGLYFSVNALTMLATRPFVGRLIDRHGFVRIAVPGTLISTMALILIGFSDRLWMFLAAAFINAFGYGAIQPSLQALSVRSVPPEQKGSASSTFYIGMDCAQLFGPSLAGYVASVVGYTPYMWLLMAIPLVLGIMVIWSCRSGILAIEAREY